MCQTGCLSVLLQLMGLKQPNGMCTIIITKLVTEQRFEFMTSAPEVNSY